MSLDACAAIVERGDPDRFLATMAAPPAAREVLFPLYAFNIEVARAPVVTNEPEIAAIRLAWWREALDEIASGGPVRRHEVVVPLAQALRPGQAEALDDLVLARQGRSPEEARALLAGAIMTPGCATCDAEMLLSEAVSLMTGRRMHRLVVTENDQPTGVISMTDVVRKLIGA